MPICAHSPQCFGMETSYPAAPSMITDKFAEHNRPIQLLALRRRGTDQVERRYVAAAFLAKWRQWSTACGQVTRRTSRTKPKAMAC
eukprot:3693212-Amphidinium_carterae.1